jgi:uncharacterized protein YyaL (SSP411 family)
MANHLKSETSPYLAQHADNPVEWYPWGEAALALAASSNKPILLSVGYSACHWCHVMAHESFEDPAIAALMNQLFVNIKVDREERPDLDKIYQTAHQLLTQQGGGWPLTVFLTPNNQLPFFSGTYFPPEPRHGMPAFPTVLQRVADYFKGNFEELERQGHDLVGALESLNPPGDLDADLLNETPLQAARDTLADQFDRDNGGFGAAPKFPHATHIDRLLRHWRATATGDAPDVKALFMTSLTLTRMAERGLFDQLAGGFFRYSVDANWMIPHFEKMLYDNAALLASYSDAFAATSDEFFGQAAAETAGWLLKDMQDSAGGFYGTLDADSEGHEGKFYVWQLEEAEAVLDETEYAVVSERFGLNGPSNFEGEAWHLYQANSLEEVAAKVGVSQTRVSELLDHARIKLLAHREQRVWPGRDEKILTSWNGLTIRGLAIASRRLHQPALAEAGAQAARFIREQLWTKPVLMALSTHGQPRFNGYLDDYAFVADGLMELLQCRWNQDEAEWLVELLDALLERFEDPQGGLFFTSHDHESLIHRPKHFSDDATPSGNGVAAEVLIKAGHLFGEHRYLQAAERILKAGWPALAKFPHGHDSLLNALELWLTPPQLVIIRGDDASLSEWQALAQAGYTPQRLCFAIESSASGLPGLLEKRAVLDSGNVAYFCHGMVCDAPITNLTDLASALTSPIA